MKKIIFLFLFTNLLLAQNGPQLQWAKVQPNSEVGGTVSIVSGAKDSSGNLYFIGNFNNTVDFDSSTNITKLTSISKSDLFISKFNSNGDFIWARNIGGLGAITPRNIEIVGTNLYVTGSYTGSIDFDSSTNLANQTSNGESDFFIVKYDLDGIYSLATTIGGIGSDEALDIKFFNNEIIIVGSFIDTVDFDPSVSTFELVSSGSLTDIFVSKYTPNLEFLSAFKIGGTNSDTATSLAIDPTGNLFLTGLYRETVDFDPSTNATNLSSTSTDASNAYIAKYSNSGSFIWVKDIGARSSLNAINKITLDSANAILVCGGFNLTSDFNPSPTATITLTPSFSVYNDAFVAKYDATGNYVWARMTGSVQGNDNYHSIATDSSNNIYVAGENKFSSLGNGLITKYNASGSAVFTFNIGLKAAKIILESTLNSMYVFGNFINNTDFNPSSTVTNYLYAEINNGFFAKYTLDGNYTFSKSVGGGISSNNAFNLISTDGNGNVYRTGNLGSALDLDPSSNVANVSSSGWTDFYIAKYTANGDYVWGKTIEGLEFNGVNMMNTDTNGNTYILGRFSGTVDFDPSSNSLLLTTSTNALETFIAKYDTEGNFIWVKKISGTISPSDTIEFDDLGNFYFTGRFTGSIDFNPSTGITPLSTLTNIYDIFFVKFDSQGNLIWAKSLSGSPSAITNINRIYIKSNNLFLTGIFMGTIDFNPSSTESANILGNNPAGFLAKYDLNGNYNFSFKLEESTQSKNVWGNNVVVDSNNEIYLITEFAGSVDFDPSTTNSSLLTSSAYVLGISKYTVDGSFLWAKSIQCIDPNSQGFSINDFQCFIDPNNSITICGDFGGSYDFNTSTIENNTLSSTFDTTANQYLSNIYIAKYNLNGELISANKLDGDYNSTLTSAIYTNNHELLISGSYNGSIDFDLTNTSQIVSSSSNNYDDRFFAKYYNSTLSISEHNNRNSFIIYPNPTSSLLNIYNPFLNDVKVKVTDLTGKILYSGTMSNDIELNVANYSIGLYIINIEDIVNNKTETYKFLKE